MRLQLFLQRYAQWCGYPPLWQSYTLFKSTQHDISKYANIPRVETVLAQRQGKMSRSRNADNVCYKHTFECLVII